MQDSKYRDNVCVVVKHPEEERFLFCHRIGYAPEEGWQFPQGGIDDIEADLLSEAKRELSEEIGTTSVSVIKISPQSYTYIFPKEVVRDSVSYVGQRQQWVYTQLEGAEEQINLNSSEHPEFDKYVWASVDEVLEKIVDFKKPVYQKALKDLHLL